MEAVVREGGQEGLRGLDRGYGESAHNFPFRIRLEGDSSGIGILLADTYAPCKIFASDMSVPNTSRDIILLEDHPLSNNRPLVGGVLVVEGHFGHRAIPISVSVVMSRVMSASDSLLGTSSVDASKQSAK